jgi:hypothetical protein
MQWGRGRPEPPRARGAEAWLPALVLAITQILLVVALIWFFLVARTVKPRNELPRMLIPGAMAVATVLVLMMIRRIWLACRIVGKAWRKR